MSDLPTLITQQKTEEKKILYDKLCNAKHGIICMDKTREGWGYINLMHAIMMFLWASALATKPNPFICPSKPQ